MHSGATGPELLEHSANYVEQKKIFQLFESLLQTLLIHRPEKPISHLINVLKRDDAPRVVVSGPPGAQARSVCELIAARSHMVHVVASDVWRELARLNSASGLRAKELVENGFEVSDELLLNMLKENFKREWVLLTRT